MPSLQNWKPDTSAKVYFQNHYLTGKDIVLYAICERALLNAAKCFLLTVSKVCCSFLCPALVDILFPL